MVKKIKSGIFGMNALMDGGINENSSTVVIGSSGAGKTLFATQFLLRGLEIGQEGVFITLDEPPYQIINEAKEMGWLEVEDCVKEKRLIFVDASGRQFINFIKKELSDFCNEWTGANARIVIDPLTPVMWSVETKYEQRDIISYLLRQTRRIGTVLCTLEEHGTTGDLSGPETVIPMYLSDSVIHLRYTIHQDFVRRVLKIVKCRRSKHSHKFHTYHIIRGPGIVVEPSPSKKREKNVNANINVREYYRQKLTKVPAEKLRMTPQRVLRRLKRAVDLMAEDKPKDVDLRMVVNLMLEEYGLI